MVLDEQQRRVDEGNSRRFLLVLDEAATVASLDELDQLAATVTGLSVTLVTVIQDFAQLVARWGLRAATIVNNHTIGSFSGDWPTPRSVRICPNWWSPKRPEVPGVSIRRLPRGTGLVVAEGRAVFHVRLRPWWRDRSLRDRGVRPR